MSLLGANHFDTLQNFKKSNPDTNLILLTSTIDETILFKAVNSGISGFFLKSSSFSDLLATIQRAAVGEVIVPSSLLVRMLRRVPRSKAVIQDPEGIWEQLTAREIEILSFLAQGRTGKDIAAELNITPLTVRTHVRNLMSKMGVHSRLEAVSFGLRHGIITS